MHWGQILGILVSVITVTVALISFWRSGRWRETEEAKRMDSRLTDCEKKVAVLEEARTQHATREDIGRLTAEVHAVRDQGHQTVAGLRRIEGYLMRKGARDEL